MRVFSCPAAGCGVIAASVLGLVLCTTLATAQDAGRYRNFELGQAPTAVSALTGLADSAFKPIHQRPVLIQELTWRPRQGVRPSPIEGFESVEQIVFDFYDARLFRMTVDYDRKQTEGLTDADMVDALSAVYGSAVLPLTPARRLAPSYEDLGMRIADWGGENTSVTLYRQQTYATAFRLVIADGSVAALARTAAARALALDAREAPQREAARLKKEADDRRAEDEKARSKNKPAFRP